MKKLLLLALVNIIFSSASYARDSVGAYSIQEAMDSDAAKQALGDNVAFYFGEQKTPKIEKSYGEFKTNKKTNAFNKSDKEACEWVFLSAMVSLKERALKEGGNAVVNIKSNYKGNLVTSNDTFQCGAGALIAGVALVGDVVKIKK
ncbi:hypothetical protein TDB9533_03891 [Thalassocella blandensis]|nr:hypothetical protein TDB9533_03891 [Thalassocella blandensis]